MSVRGGEVVEGAVPIGYDGIVGVTTALEDGPTSIGTPEPIVGPQQSALRLLRVNNAIGDATEETTRAKQAAATTARRGARLATGLQESQTDEESKPWPTPATGLVPPRRFPRWSSFLQPTQTKHDFDSPVL